MAEYEQSKFFKCFRTEKWGVWIGLLVRKCDLYVHMHTVFKRISELCGVDVR